MFQFAEPWDEAMEQPLSGMSVVGPTQIDSRPYATFLLAEAGADAIKSEAPGGERLRLASGAAATPFATSDAGTRSATVATPNFRQRTAS